MGYLKSWLVSILSKSSSTKRVVYGFSMAWGMGLVTGIVIKEGFLSLQALDLSKTIILVGGGAYGIGKFIEGKFQGKKQGAEEEAK